MKLPRACLLTLTLISGYSNASAIGYIGKTLSVLDSPFCKKYRCRFTNKQKMPRDYKFPGSIIYIYSISTSQDAVPKLIVTRLNNKIIETTLLDMKYSNATNSMVPGRGEGIIPLVLKDFFSFSTGNNTNKLLWDVYYNCEKEDIGELPNYLGAGLFNVGSGFSAACGLNPPTASFSILRK